MHHDKFLNYKDKEKQNKLKLVSTHVENKKIVTTSLKATKKSSCLQTFTEANRKPWRDNINCVKIKRLLPENLIQSNSDM